MKTTRSKKTTKAPDVKFVDLAMLLPQGFHLEEGAHTNFGKGYCAMELVDYVDRVRRGNAVTSKTKLSDHPECTCPSIAAFLRSWNDSLPDADRTRLIAPLVILALDTNTGTADTERRAWMATDWQVRVFTPAWLELAGLADDAKALRELPEIASTETARASYGIIKAVQDRAAAARDAAWDAARAAARDAAWDAAWDAARAAARDAARAAAHKKLSPTVAELQASGQKLVERMCAVGRKP